MSPPSAVPVQPVLRACLHLLVVGLLALAAARAVAEDAPHAGAVLAAAVAVGLIYAIGPVLPRVRRSPTAAAAWLTALGVSWLVLLYWTPDGIWLAFPLFFVQLHLLPMRWGLTAVATTTAAAIAGFAWHRDGLTAPMVLGPVLGAAVAVATVLGYQALYRESEARRRLIDELTAARADLAAAEHTGGVLAERERLAREIHDTLAQGLSSIQLLLRAAERALPDRPDNALDHVRQACQAAVDNLAEARRFVRDWTPPGLEVAGSLPTALKQLCATTVKTSGLAVHASISGAPIELPAAQETALLRIAQAALANAVQHGHASRIELTLSYMGTDVALDIVDDGTGFEPDLVAPPGQGADGTGFGLAAMRARARALQGTLIVESAPGKGTAVAATLPVPVDTVAEVSA
ncbi:sensor histidine kinase [Blastococcus saxobsidens]|uniref:Oxygen sensor histidine kinase NreB n=1 Tax=Blastococcus saxobsidens TaxID=138336 RepID=A0A6L9W5F9_9ACTN|nr:sensor histidine kinase [Blastococcus saxobsidens]NEK87248.1 sensor histidine kinase [Blastococcus saxobsidens]